MARFDFCGGTYQSQSPNLDAERCINRYPEVPESGGAKSRMALLPSPGLKKFSALGATSLMGQVSCRPNGSTSDRVFAVVQNGANQALYEVFSDGTNINLGALVAPTSFPVSMFHNGLQLLICTGGQVWVFTFATNVLVAVAGAPANIAMVEYVDGFFIALIANSNKFYVSALLDGTSWPGLSVAQVFELPDNVVTMIVNQRTLWFSGVKGSVPYYNSGALNVPFVPASGVYIENGCGAAFSRVKLDNSVLWLDADERGNAVARRANGYTPERISTHAVEQTWQSYPRIDDAIGYAFQYQGHAFWHLYFPSGISALGTNQNGASWRFDVATGMWSEVAYWNVARGRYEAHHSQNHCFAWGRHLVGDWSTGNIYEMAAPVQVGGVWKFADDDGNPIRRSRRAPHISNENEWIEYSRLTLDVETGLGPTPALTGTSDSPNSFILPDDLGNSWLLQILDNGTLSLTATTGTPQVIILNDNVTLNSSVQLMVGGGLLTTTVVRYDGYPMNIPMATVGGKQSGLFVAGGLVQSMNVILAPRGPQISMRYSKDHCHTFSNWQARDAGQAGEYAKRVFWDRLGRGRTMTFEVVDADPVPIRIIDAYVKASGAADFKPIERLSKQLAKQA